MKQIILFLCVVFLSTETLKAQNTIGGTRTKDTTIATNIVVTSNLIVKSGVKLTILPGVKVQTARNITFSVNGSIVAKGTTSMPIVFKMLQYAWEGIDIVSSTSNPDSCIFENCTFRDA